MKIKGHKFVSYPLSLTLMEAIVLHVLKFGDYDQIATLFTADIGLIKLIYKGGQSHRKGPLTPLTRVELTWRPGKGELGLCEEQRLLEGYRALRSSFNHLQAACHLADAVRRTQLPGKPAPALYALFQVYLNQLTLLQEPTVGVVSFYLKLLKHEGLFPAHLAGFNELPVSFSAEEGAAACALAHCLRFQELATLSCSQDLAKKVRRWVESSIEN